MVEDRMGMIERVARAICVAERMNDDDPLGGWLHWQEAARAAIEAMRDAPFDVLDAGVCHEVTAFREDAGQQTVTLKRCHVSGRHILGLWQAMIDAVLSEPKEGRQS